MGAYRFLADAIVLLHAAYVAFVGLGLLLVLCGWLWGWRWVRAFWFRAIHLVAIVVVAGEAIFGITCPLTHWETQLREAAGQTVREGSFVGYWAHELIFLDAPEWAFTLGYCLFALLVAATMVLVPPRWPGQK